MAEPNLTSVRDDQALERIIREGNRSVRIEHLRNRPHSWFWNWVVLGDGTTLSVIAGAGAYCTPRAHLSDTEPYDGPYAAVEVWWPNTDEPSAFVPAEEVRDYAALHGGVVGVAGTSDAARDLHQEVRSG